MHSQGHDDAEVATRAGLHRQGNAGARAQRHCPTTAYDLVVYDDHTGAKNSKSEPCLSGVMAAPTEFTGLSRDAAQVASVQQHRLKPLRLVGAAELG